MNRNKWILALVTVLMIGSTAMVLAKFKAHQRLGEPGVKTRPIPNSQTVEVVLPERVLDYSSEWRAQDAMVTNALPKDTCYGQRVYIAPDKKFWVQSNVVLMGTDRASLHKPQFCLTGAGWTINKTEVDTIRIEKPHPYDLQVIKLTVSGQIPHEGQLVPAHGVYVYWYVADDALSADPTGSDRMWSMAKDLLTTGVLQRWAYVTYFAVGAPGQEDAIYARMKQLIAASVPEFQLATGSPVSLAGVQP